MAPLGNNTILRDISLHDANVLMQERRFRAANCLDIGPRDGIDGSTSEGLRIVPAGPVPKN